jgi:hypothetical protein
MATEGALGPSVLTTYHGRMLDVEIKPESTTYTMREGEELSIRHEGEPINMTRAKPSSSGRHSNLEFEVLKASSG